MPLLQDITTLTLPKIFKFLNHINSRLYSHDDSSCFSGSVDDNDRMSYHYSRSIVKNIKYSDSIIINTLHPLEIVLEKAVVAVAITLQNLVRGTNPSSVVVGGGVGGNEIVRQRLSW